MKQYLLFIPVSIATAVNAWFAALPEEPGANTFTAGLVPVEGLSSADATWLWSCSYWEDDIPGVVATFLAAFPSANASAVDDTSAEQRAAALVSRGLKVRTLPTF